MDGRRANEVRRIAVELGVLTGVDGSACYEQGNTKVVVSVYGPKEVERRSDMKHDQASVTCEFQLAPFSNPERTKLGRNSKRTKEMESILRQSFEKVILTSLFPRSQIQICVQVLQNDASLLSACINATTLALIDAGIPLSNYLVSCTAGFVNAVPIVDLNWTEYSANGPELMVGILSGSRDIVVLDMRSKIPKDHFDRVLTLAIEGSEAIQAVISQTVEENARRLLQSRGNIN